MNNGFAMKLWQIYRTRILPMIPSSWASTSIVALSVSYEGDVYVRDMIQLAKTQRRVQSREGHLQR